MQHMCRCIAIVEAYLVVVQAEDAEVDVAPGQGAYERVEHQTNALYTYVL